MSLFYSYNKCCRQMTRVQAKGILQRWWTAGLNKSATLLSPSTLPVEKPSRSTSCSITQQYLGMRQMCTRLGQSSYNTHNITVHFKILIKINEYWSVNIFNQINEHLKHYFFRVWERNSLCREHRDFSLCRPLTCTNFFLNQWNK